ncbi:MAG: pyridoxamine 5'-phosphate oxidase family protein [Desulfovibrio sp.]|nr:pyridoxamine 5'-phosphate oxidase family protein [Desulfovibrio sp.]
MRRSDRAMSSDWAWQLIISGEYGVLSLATEDGPYGIPLSYVVADGKIYFHSARQGRKIAALAQCRKVSFVVVGRTQPVYTSNFTTYFESAIVHGFVHEVTSPEQKMALLKLLAAKYLPAHGDQAEQAISHALARTMVLCLDPLDISGKAKLPADGSWAKPEGLLS